MRYTTATTKLIAQSRIDSSNDKLSGVTTGIKYVGNGIKKLFSTPTGMSPYTAALGAGIGTVAFPMISRFSYDITQQTPYTMPTRMADAYLRERVATAAAPVGAVGGIYAATRVSKFLQALAKQGV